MYCNQCGKEIPDNSKFCNECGCAVSTNDMTQQLLKDNTEENIVETNGHTTNNIATKKNLFHNKKLLIASISAISVVVVFAVLMFTHVICLWHDYSDATIIEPQTCRYCDKTKGEPKPLSEIEFPTKGLATLLPTPKSNMGEIGWDNSDSVYIYIGNTTESDFKDYIKECSDKGFDIDYQKGDDYYYADDINGNRLSLHYKENNVMSIEIRSPRDDESEDNTSDGESDSSVEEDTSSNESPSKEDDDDDDNNSTTVLEPYDGAVKVCQKIKDSLNNPDSLQLHEILHVTYNGCDYYYIDLSAMNKMGGYTRTRYYAMFMDGVLFKLEEMESFSYEDIINSKFDDLEYLEVNKVESRLK